MSEGKANVLGLVPLVEIIAQTSVAIAPLEFATAPSDAINTVLIKSRLTSYRIDLYEINEEFDMISLKVNKLLNLDYSKVNVKRGAIAFEHHIGSSGARILIALIHAMKRRNYIYRLAFLCICGGGVSAIIVKNYSK
jgi:acetyl-CoA C-acetyltransferase